MLNNTDCVVSENYLWVTPDPSWRSVRFLFLQIVRLNSLYHYDPDLVSQSLFFSKWISAFKEPIFGCLLSYQEIVECLGAIPGYCEISTCFIY